LSPNDKECRPRTVLPARHRARVQLLDVEARVLGRERVRAVSILVPGCAWVSQLAQSEVTPSRQERLGVALQRERRRRRVVEPAGEAEQLLVEVSEEIVRGITTDYAQVRVLLRVAAVALVSCAELP